MTKIDMPHGTADRPQAVFYTYNYRQLNNTEGRRIVFPMEQHNNCLINIKWPALKTYTIDAILYRLNKLGMHIHVHIHAYKYT